MSNLVKNTTIYALGDIIPRLLSFITFPILTTYLTTAEYGIINYINTINLFLMAIGFMCVNTYYLVFYYKIINPVEKQKLLGNLSIFVIGVNVIFSFLLFLGGNYFFKSIGSNVDFYPYIAIGILTNFFNLFGVLPSALFRVQERPLPLTIINVVKSILTVAITLLLVIKYDFKASGVLYSGMFVSAFFSIIFIYITKKNMLWNINWTQIKEALIFSLPLLPGTISYYLMSMFDRILIDKYLTLEDLGVYSTASTLALMVNIITFGTYKAIEPYFFKIYNNSDFINQFTKIHNVFLFLVVIGSMGLSLFAKEFFYFFSSAQFHISYYYVPLILIGILFSSMRMLFTTVITAKGKTKINSIITVVGGILSVVLNIYLLPYFGLVGACFTSGITLFLMLVISMYYSHLNISYSYSLFVFIVSVIFVYLFVYFFNISDVFLSVAIKIVIYLIYIVIVIFILKIKPKELKLLS